MPAVNIIPSEKETNHPMYLQIYVGVNIYFSYKNVTEPKALAQGWGDEIKRKRFIQQQFITILVNKIIIINTYIRLPSKKKSDLFKSYVKPRT